LLTPTYSNPIPKTYSSVRPYPLVFSLIHSTICLSTPNCNKSFLTSLIMSMQLFLVKFKPNKLLREAVTKVIFLVAQPLRGRGGEVKAGPLKKTCIAASLISSNFPNTSTSLKFVHLQVLSMLFLFIPRYKGKLLTSSNNNPWSLHFGQSYSHPQTYPIAYSNVI